MNASTFPETNIIIPPFYFGTFVFFHDDLSFSKKTLGRFGHLLPDPPVGPRIHPTAVEAHIAPPESKPPFFQQNKLRDIPGKNVGNCLTPPKSDEREDLVKNHNTMFIKGFVSPLSLTSGSLFLKLVDLKLLTAHFLCLFAASPQSLHFLCAAAGTRVPQ